MAEGPCCSASSLLLLEKIRTSRFDAFCAEINKQRNQRAAEEGNKPEAIQRYGIDKQRFEEITGLGIKLRKN